MRTSAPVRLGGIATAWPSRLLCTLVLLLVCIPTGAEGQTAPQSNGTATIVDATGETTRVTDIRSDLAPGVDLEAPLKGGYIAYGSLYPRLESLAKVVHLGSPNSRSSKLTFRDGLSVVGTLSGKLQARTNLGDYTIDWSDIKELTFGEDAATSAAAGNKQPPNDGVEASVVLDSSDAPGWRLALELSGAKLWYMYVSGNTTGPGYTRTLEAVPLVLSEGASEVDVPFALIDSVTRTRSKTLNTTLFNVKLLPNSKVSRDSFEGEISSLRERVFNNPELRGYDGHGSWYIHTLAISSVRFVPGTAKLSAAQAVADLDIRPDTAPHDGNTLATWEKQLMTVEAATGTVTLAKGSGTVDIDLGKVSSVQSTKLPANKGETHLAIVMKDGSVLDGNGHISARVLALDEAGLFWLLTGPSIQSLNLQVGSRSR